MLISIMAIVSTDDWTKIYELSGLSTTLLTPVKWLVNKKLNEVEGIVIRGINYYYHSS
jgi:hypothetical protein